MTWYTWLALAVLAVVSAVGLWWRRMKPARAKAAEVASAHAARVHERTTIDTIRARAAADGVAEAAREEIKRLEAIPDEKIADAWNDHFRPDGRPK